MISKIDRKSERARRHARVRAKITGTTECPRLAVTKTNKNIIAQIIDDTKGVTLCYVSTLDSDIKTKKANVEAELEKANSNFANAQSTIQTLTAEKEDLANFKAGVLKKEKEAVIDSYTTLLDAEVITTFKEKIDEMTREELEKELAYTLVQSQPTLFTNKESDPGYVPKDQDYLDGSIEGVLSRYKNK